VEDILHSQLLNLLRSRTQTILRISKSKVHGFFVTASTVTKLLLSDQVYVRESLIYISLNSSPIACPSLGYLCYTNEYCTRYRTCSM